MGTILVIDLGTSYFKAALFDHDGRMQASSRQAVPASGEAEGRVELSAEAFETLVAKAVGELSKRRPDGLSDVEVTTFATQTNSFLLLDDRDRPLTPLILWPDRRAIEFEAQVRQRFDAPAAAAKTGVPQVNHQFMLAKLLWLQQHQPDVWKQAVRLCLISDYLTLLFTGRHVTDAGAAGLTGLLDIRQCQWLPEIVTGFGIKPESLPAIARPGTDLGIIVPQAARRFGLPESCRFAVGCLDQYAGAVGAGNVEPGRVSETTGTVLASVLCTDRMSSDLPAGVFQGPAFAPNRFFQMVFGDLSANYLEWYRNRQQDRPDFDRLIAMAEKIEPGAGGLRVRPEAGLTQPANVFHGLSPRHTQGHMVRCILEAVASSLRKQVATLCSGTLPDEIRSVGGAARSGVWLQIKADVLGVSTRAIDCQEPTCMGAALLAEASLSGTDVPSIARQWVLPGQVHQPDQMRHRRYRELGL